jgi:hypothetical protein
MNIELHIDTLVLHGFNLTDRAAVTAAVECELARLLAKCRLPLVPWQGSITTQSDSEACTLAHSAIPAAISLQVAQAIYGGL